AVERDTMNRRELMINHFKLSGANPSSKTIGAVPIFLGIIDTDPHAPTIDIYFDPGNTHRQFVTLLIPAALCWNKANELKRVTKERFGLAGSEIATLNSTEIVNGSVVGYGAIEQHRVGADIDAIPCFGTVPRAIQRRPLLI